MLIQIGIFLNCTHFVYQKTLDIELNYFVLLMLLNSFLILLSDWNAFFKGIKHNNW